MIAYTKKRTPQEIAADALYWQMKAICLPYHTMTSEELEKSLPPWWVEADEACIMYNRISNSDGSESIEHEIECCLGIEKRAKESMSNFLLKDKKMISISFKKFDDEYYTGRIIHQNPISVSSQKQIIHEKNDTYLIADTDYAPYYDIISKELYVKTCRCRKPECVCSNPAFVVPVSHMEDLLSCIQEYNSREKIEISDEFII